MKFDVVDPADRPDDTGFGEPAGPAEADVAHTGGETDEQGEAEQDPQARLKASTRQLSMQVRQGAALVGGSLAKLAHRVAELEVADTGHGSAPTPSTFRADRFSTGDRGGSAGTGGAASCTRVAPASPGPEGRDHDGTARASGAPDHR